LSAGLQLFKFALGLATVWPVYHTARRREVTAGLILALTLYMGLKHLRHQVFFFLAAGACLPVLFEAYGKNPPDLILVDRRSKVYPLLKGRPGLA
jgi:hypothetical protein